MMARDARPPRRSLARALRPVGLPTQETSVADRTSRDTDGGTPSDREPHRDRYRDDDDVRDPTPEALRNETRPDSRFEARGDARENVGNHARGTDAHPTGPEGNDRTKHRSDRPDQFDDDLARDNRRGRDGEGMGDLAEDTRAGMAGMPFVQDNPTGDARHAWRSHARQGQAESPVELTHHEPPKKKRR